jgi:rhamnose transport system permease protein
VTHPAAGLTAPAPASGRPFTAAFSHWHELVLVALLAGLMIYARATEPRFVTPAVQLEMSADLWERAILALPITLIVITAGIDLSVGSAMALSAVVMGVTFRAGVPMPAAVVVALLTGLACGLLNGMFVAFVRVHPLLVTLATLSAYRGFAEGISRAEPIKGFPDWFDLSGGPAAVLVPGLIFAVAAVFTAVVLAKTPFGRSVYAMGYNETACRFSGVPTRRIKLALYAAAGLAAGVAAVIYSARVKTVTADQGSGFELDVITAVVLGGTSIFGGRGNIVGTALGLLLIHETRQFVAWRWQTEVLILVVVGALLILSVLLNTLLSPRGRE